MEPILFFENKIDFLVFSVHILFIVELHAVSEEMTRGQKIYNVFRSLEPCKARCGNMCS